MEAKGKTCFRINDEQEVMFPASDFNYNPTGIPFIRVKSNAVRKVIRNTRRRLMARRKLMEAVAE